MVKPGVNQVALMPRSFRNCRMRPRRHRAELAARQRRRRGHAAGDEAGLSVEIEGEADDVAGHGLLLAKFLRGQGCDAEPSITFRHGHSYHRHHPQRRDRAHLLDAASRQRAGADPRRGRAAGRRRPHRAAADAGRAQRREARRHRQELRRGMDHRPRQGAGRSGLHGVLRRRRDQPAAGRAGEGHRRRQAHLFREAGGAVGRPRGWSCCAP